MMRWPVKNTKSNHYNGVAAIVAARNFAAASAKSAAAVAATNGDPSALAASD